MLLEEGSCDYSVSRCLGMFCVDSVSRVTLFDIERFIFLLCGIFPLELVNSLRMFGRILGGEKGGEECIEIGRDLKIWKIVGEGGARWER